jgi:hypothetical protein
MNFWLLDALDEAEIRTADQRSAHRAARGEQHVGTVFDRGDPV